MNEKELIDYILEEKILNKNDIYNNIINPDTPYQMKGNITMKKISALIAAVAILAVLSTTVYAVYSYLNPKEVAVVFDDKNLASAFEETDIPQETTTVTDAGYEVAFIGLAIGSELDEYDNIEKDETYSIVAINNADGTPMDINQSMDFLVTPVIKGYNPMQYSVMTMGGGKTSKIIDGVLYTVVSCDSVEIFAHNGIQLCVLDETFYTPFAFNMDATTGAFTSNESFDGLNVVFDVPIDPAKGNEQAVQQYIADQAKEMEQGMAEGEAAEAEADEALKALSVDLIKSKGTLIEGTKQTGTGDDTTFIYDQPVEGMDVVNELHFGIKRVKDIAQKNGNFYIADVIGSDTNVIILLVEEMSDGSYEGIWYDYPCTSENGVITY